MEHSEISQCAQLRSLIKKIQALAAPPKIAETTEGATKWIPSLTPATKSPLAAMVRSAVVTSGLKIRTKRVERDRVASACFSLQCLVKVSAVPTP